MALRDGILLKDIPQKGLANDTTGLLGNDPIRGSGLFDVSGVDGPVFFAGEPLFTGQALYLNTDGKIYPALATSAPESLVYGFALSDADEDAEAVITTTFATISAPLIVSQLYYLSDTTPGAITNVAPSVAIPVGIATSTTLLRILPTYIGT